MSHQYPISDRLSYWLDHMPAIGIGCAVTCGENVFSYAVGQADREQSAPLEKESAFNIASVGKLFTITAIFKLIESGKLRLDMPLEELLVNIPPQWNKVNITQLLTHSSGIKNYTEMPDYWKECTVDVPRERILEYVQALPLEFHPGTQWKYSNTGFFLLGLIIEAVSGKEYFDFVLNMISHDNPKLRIFPTNDRKAIPGCSTGYYLQNGTIEKAPYYSNAGTFSAGGFSANLLDFMTFEKSLFSGCILGQQSIEMISMPFKKQNGETLQSPEDIPHFQMTHGLFKFNRNELSVLAHRGETVGFSSCYKRIPQRNMAVIVCANTSGALQIDQIADDILDIVSSQSQC